MSDRPSSDFVTRRERAQRARAAREAAERLYTATRADQPVRTARPDELPDTRIPPAEQSVALERIAELRELACEVADRAHANGVAS